MIFPKVFVTGGYSRRKLPSTAYVNALHTVIKKEHPEKTFSFGSDISDKIIIDWVSKNFSPWEATRLFQITKLLVEKKLEMFSSVRWLANFYGEEVSVSAKPS